MFLPLVDAEVGRYLFENCILGILKDKIRILVTHQLQFLKAADELLLLNGGLVETQGSYSHLLKSGINFAQLLNAEGEGNSQSHPPPEEDAGMALKYKGREMLGIILT